MNFKVFLLTILSGFAGTIGMTAVMYLYASLAKKNTKVVHILGSMVTGNLDYSKPEKIKTLVTGAIAHVSVGVLFSFSYFLLWNWGVFSISTFHSLIVGGLSGVLAIIVWKLYISVYHNPPKINLTHYFTALLISHIIFGFITVNVFRIIANNPQFWFHFQEKINN